MARKHEALKAGGVPRQSASEAAPNHWYRYHANLGTFHAHRWLKRWNKWDALADLERAHTLITAAIEDNPNAHFGRESYQLRVVAWLLERPKMPPIGPPPSFIAIGHIQDNDLGDAISALCGLITLGAAWNSFDVTFALLRLLLADGRHSLARIARARCEEIVNAGGGSLVIGAPTERELIWHVLETKTRVEIPPGPSFTTLRAQAKAWSRRRAIYMRKRLERGEHPDTHPDFWMKFEGDPTRMDVDGLLGDPTRARKLGEEPPVGPREGQAANNLEVPQGMTDTAGPHCGACSISGTDAGFGVGLGTLALALARRRSRQPNP